MTREEIIRLLRILTKNYSKKVDDAETLANNWEMILGSYSAASVYKAARLHMSTSKYFPNPAEIREKIIKAELIFDDAPKNAIEAHSHKTLDEEVKIWEPYLDAFCQWIGFGCDPNPDIDLRDFLPYEK
jgi:hypothetical protein